MKNILRNIIICLIMIILSSANVFADGLVNGVNFAVNGEVISYDQYIYIDNGEILVPIRSLYKSSKYDIEQNDNEITIRRGFVCVKFFVNSNRVVVNSQEKVLNTRLRTVVNRIYIPLKVVEDALNCEVHWDGISVVDVIEDQSYSDQEYSRLNLDEELKAKKFAMNFYDENLKFVERVTIGKDECYVFARNYDDTDLVAVDRGCSKIYSVIKYGDMYKNEVLVYHN